MLHQFLAANRDELIRRCRAKVAKRASPQPTAAELTHGVPLFLQQLTETLRLDAATDAMGSHRISGAADQPSKAPTATQIGESAAAHGDELQRLGFSVDQVVHDYGDLCQAITELAVVENAAITVEEFHTLNRCLDNAVADAVTRFGSEREQTVRDQGAAEANARLGSLAHELGAKLNVVRLAVAAIKRGTVGSSGATSAVLDLSLNAMRDLIDRSFAEVRLGAGLPAFAQRISIARLFEGIQIFAGIEAGAKGVTLAVHAEPKLAVDADRHTLGSAVSNLVHNAIKFTPPGGRISLGARAAANRVLIEVSDACGGLPAGGPATLFEPFAQRGRARRGPGLGLSISKRGVEANGGTLYATNRPGFGCVFTVDLPAPEPSSI